MLAFIDGTTFYLARGETKAGDKARSRLGSFVWRMSTAAEDFSGEILAKQCEELCAKHPVIRVDAAAAANFAASIAMDDILTTAPGPRDEDNLEARLR